MLHLVTSQVTSKIIYGREVYFTASKTVLEKLDSIIDSKAAELALGVPIHSNSKKNYSEVLMLPLSEQRKLAAVKYFVGNFLSENSVTSDILIDYNKNDVSPLLDPISVDISKFIPSLAIPALPPWEHFNASFDINYRPKIMTTLISLLLK